MLIRNVNYMKLTITLLSHSNYDIIFNWKHKNE